MPKITKLFNGLDKYTILVDLCHIRLLLKRFLKGWVCSSFLERGRGKCHHWKACLVLKYYINKKYPIVVLPFARATLYSCLDFLIISASSYKRNPPTVHLYKTNNGGMEPEKNGTIRTQTMKACFYHHLAWTAKQQCNILNFEYTLPCPNNSIVIELLT